MFDVSGLVLEFPEESGSELVPVSSTIPLSGVGATSSSGSVSSVPAAPEPCPASPD